MTLHEILREMAAHIRFADESARRKIMAAITDHEREHQAAAAAHEQLYEPASQPAAVPAAAVLTSNATATPVLLPPSFTPPAPGGM